jgi:thiamine-phosphate pyrophosphorylase
MLRGFYFITDARLSRVGILSDVKQAISAGVCAVQYRNKEASAREMIEEALKLRKICRRIPLIINDRVDIALAVKADGVHLGQNDMPIAIARKILGKNKIIGLTVHSLPEAERAQREGANYLGVSPIFVTHTKSDAGKPVGTGLIIKIKSKCGLPLVAIAGIKLENARRVIKAGADAICAVSGVIGKNNVTAEINKFQRLF